MMPFGNSDEPRLDHLCLIVLCRVFVPLCRYWQHGCGASCALTRLAVKGNAVRGDPGAASARRHRPACLHAHLQGEALQAGRGRGPVVVCLNLAEIRLNLAATD